MTFNTSNSPVTDSATTFSDLDETSQVSFIFFEGRGSWLRWCCGWLNLNGIRIMRDFSCGSVDNAILYPKLNTDRRIIRFLSN
ncbi:hypothetical protein NPIL_178641 [Nephila pilipes]|uniref:Uncharacterized protein n=1 Tax=Nephila pilipes TaxID=299642 RepID=A0A8X6N501_NEPPI|nr:hypothetical protein NPIL_178641 [Nephila pilipes]